MKESDNTVYEPVSPTSLGQDGTMHTCDVPLPDRKRLQRLAFVSLGRPVKERLLGEDVHVARVHVRVDPGLPVVRGRPVQEWLDSEGDQLPALRLVGVSFKFKKQVTFLCVVRDNLVPSLTSVTSTGMNGEARVR